MWNLKKSVVVKFLDLEIKGKCFVNKIDKNNVVNDVIFKLMVDVIVEYSFSVEDKDFFS